MDDVGLKLRKAIRNALERSISAIHHTAATKHAYMTRTGNLDRSITSEMLSDNSATVFLDNKVAPYGAYVHNGTAAHIIRPRNKRILRWAGKGGFVFAKAVNHPGFKGDPFLVNALNENMKTIEKIFNGVAESVAVDICDGIRKEAEKEFKL